MSKRGVKVKELAGELHVSSRAVIDRCRAEGVWVQNSVTRLPTHVVLLVREWFADSRSEAVPPSGAGDVDAGPA